MTFHEIQMSKKYFAQNILCNKLFKLNLLRWHWLIRLYRVQVYNSMIHDLCSVLHCMLTPQSQSIFHHHIFGPLYPYYPLTLFPLYGELFQVWETWPSPHSEKPVGSEVGRQDPRPQIGSPVGNQALIVPRPL